MPIRLWPTLLLAGFILGLIPGSTALAGEADCSDMRLELDPTRYDLSCDDGEQQVIDATARDGSHFLLIVDAISDPQTVFGDNVSLETLMKEVLNLNVAKWRPGRAVPEISTTGEFETDIKSIPSRCIGFRVNASRYGPGWRRLVLGVACGKGEIEPLYQRLEEINFPG